MIKEKGELINRKVSWIMISFDNVSINILLVNKYIIQYHIILSYYFKIYLILNLSIIDRMQPVFNDLNSTHSSLTQLNITLKVIIYKAVIKTW